MPAMTRANGVECEMSLAGPIHRLASAAQTSMSGVCFWVLWSFIGLVSIIDAYLVYACIEVIEHTEKNLVCRFLIMLDQESLSVFLPAKALGTMLVLSILRLIFVRRREYSLPITWGVAAYQAGLMLYLVV